MKEGSRKVTGTDDTAAASAVPGDGRTSSLRELTPGLVLDGRYRLVERIGRGGFGDVWRAVELLPDGASLRDVALKLLSPEMDNSGWAEEAKLLASFSHPSLVTIYATGILDAPRVPFVAMELLIGETLAEALRRTGRLPWRLALRYVREVARALDVIHGRGVIHLDLKPANIFVTEDGRVKVLDFGISRTRGAAGAHARSKAVDTPTERDIAPPHPEMSFDNLATAAFLAGTSEAYAATQLASAEDAGTPSDGGAPKVVVGTPGYVAPEVLQSATPTMLADVYALGATLAVLATGKLPQDVPEEPPDTGSFDEFRTYWLSLRDSTLKGSLRNFDEFMLPRGVVNLLVRFCAVDPDKRGVAEGELGAVLDDAWDRPHGTPDLPYPGRSAFTEAHEGFLFGRDQDLARAERHLAYEPILVVSGPVGAGKTSFIRASLLPSLAKHGVDGALDVEVETVAAGSGPDRALFTGQRTVEDVLLTEEGRARVVFIDDFEEVLAFPEADRQRTVLLIENLLLGHRHRGFRLVLAIDQESVSDVLDLSQTFLALAASVRYLTPPPEALARDIAIEPALRAGWTVRGEKQLVATISRELATVAVPLPTIAQILAESTSESEAVVPTSPESELASLTARSGPVIERRVLDGSIMDEAAITASVHRSAERAWRVIGSDEETMLDLLVMLTTSDGKPIRVAKAHVADRLGKDSIDELVGRMQRRMLVVQRGGDLELAHPGIATWAKLENARLSSLDQIALRERIAEAATQWEKSSMNPAYLARAGLLAEVDRQGVELRALSGVEVEFLSVSRRAGRRRRMFQLGVLALAAFALVLGLLYRENLIARKKEAEEKQAEADQRALRVGLVARARQARDPYERVAYFVAAVRAGAAEPALFVELLGAVSDLPPGRFLSLEPLDSVQLPWNDRWVVGRSPNGSFVVFDLRSPLAEPESLDHLDPTTDPAKASVVHRPPKRFEIAIGDAPVVDVLPVRFDTAAFVQNAAGEVHLVRLRESGEVAVAAVAPFRCRGEMTVADRAPVFACNSAGDAAIWRLDTAEVFRVSQPKGVFVLSPDGERLVTWFEREVLVHAPAKDPVPLRFEAEEEVLAASESPRDDVLAIATKSKLSLRVIAPGGAELAVRPGLPETVRVVWDKRGLDVGLCTHARQAVWSYVLEGDRPPGYAAASARCDRASELAPDFTRERFALGDFAYKNFGDHFSRGAWQLPGDRFLSTTLLLAGAREDGLARVLEFALRDSKEELLPVTNDSGFTRLVRSRDAAVVELARSNEDTLAKKLPEIVVAAAATGVRLQSARGHLLDACEDGRVLAYAANGDKFVVRDVRGTLEVGAFPRAPGRVLGVGPSCEKVYTQDLDGTLYVSTLSGSISRQRLATAHGHVFEVKRAGTAGAPGAGLLMGLSSGEVILVREATDEVVLLARANPRVSALAPGLRDDVFFADQTGVYRIVAGGEPTRIAPPRIDSAWQDLIATKGGNAVVLASPKEVAVYDLDAEQVTGSARLDGLTRGLLWDESGSVMLYPQASQGVARAELLPFGAKLPEVIGSLASNLRAEPSGALMLKR